MQTSLFVFLSFFFILKFYSWKFFKLLAKQIPHNFMAIIKNIFKSYFSNLLVLVERNTIGFHKLI